MKIISIHNNWKEDVLGIDLSIGNICNYKCTYCWPGSNSGDHKWPDYEILKENISHFINYYLKNTNKKVFDIHFVGGEPTHWPRLFDFVYYLKSNFNCLISMTSNGSKKLEWWEKISPYFDRITLSCHYQYVDKSKFRDICDLLYEKNIIVSVSAMMDPTAWNECVEIVEYLKSSKHRWTIRYVEVQGNSYHYNSDQKKILSKHRARGPNIFWFFRNNKYYRSKVTVIDENNKKHKFKDNEIILKKLNYFKGWNCSVGVDWVHIGMDGNISGTCGQLLYGGSERYNLRDENFNAKFSPTIQSSVCQQNICWCSIETVMPKNINENNKKVIPIYAN